MSLRDFFRTLCITYIFFKIKPDSKWYKEYEVDPVHSAAKPKRSNPSFEMVRKLRLKLKAEAAVVNPSDDREPRLQANGLHRGRSTSIQFHNFKIVYKRYQGLYFAVCIDINDNELLHL